MNVPLDTATGLDTGAASPRGLVDAGWGTVERTFCSELSAGWGLAVGIRDGFVPLSTTRRGLLIVAFTRVGGVPAAKLYKLLKFKGKHNMEKRIYLVFGDWSDQSQTD